MVEITRVERSKDPSFEQLFALPARIYAGNDCWVPWLRGDLAELVDRAHPLFEHTTGVFLLATRGGEPVGRIFVFENARYNATHDMKCAHFYFFDTIDDREVSDRLLEAAVDWARSRGLERVVGPMGFGGVTGTGILVEGFDQRASMTMMTYNAPYYVDLIEGFGFGKYLDNFCFHLPTTARLPDELRERAQAVAKEGHFRVLRFRSKKELARVADDIGDIFMETLSDHPGNYELSPAEIARLKRDLLRIAHPDLMKIIAHDDRVIGFLFGFHDLSRALQRSGGTIGPVDLFRLWRETKKTDWLLINGMGIVPEFQGTGANLMLYQELENTIREQPQFTDLEMVQIQETTVRMLSNVKTLNGEVRKVHRIYELPL